MKWTTEKPNKEGWYWIRKKDPYSQTGFNVYIEWVRWYREKWCILNSGIPDNVEWSGPIPEPQENKE